MGHFTRFRDFKFLFIILPVKYIFRDVAMSYVDLP